MVFNAQWTVMVIWTWVIYIINKKCKHTQQHELIHVHITTPTRNEITNMECETMSQVQYPSICKCETDKQLWTEVQRPKCMCIHLTNNNSKRWTKPTNTLHTGNTKHYTQGRWTKKKAKCSELTQPTFEITLAQAVSLFRYVNDQLQVVHLGSVA